MCEGVWVWVWAWWSVMEYGCEEVCKGVCVYNVCVCVHNVYYSVPMARLLSGTRLCVYHTYYSTITILHMQ